MLLNKKVSEINHNKLIEVTVAEQNIISEMYSSIIQSVFNCYVPKKKICRAIKDMILVETLFKDPYGIKKRAVASLDYLIYGFSLFSSIIFPLEVTDGQHNTFVMFYIPLFFVTIQVSLMH